MHLRAASVSLLDVRFLLVLPCQRGRAATPLDCTHSPRTNRRAISRGVVRRAAVLSDQLLSPLKDPHPEPPPLQHANAGPLDDDRHRPSNGITEDRAHAETSSVTPAQLMRSRHLKHLRPTRASGPAGANDRRMAKSERTRYLKMCVRLASFSHGWKGWVNGAANAEG